MSVSLKQVADRAGVSGTTVSRVLNGKTQDRIPITTREHVRRVAHEMGYAPNQFARSLREGRTSTIGLMISGLENPFFVSVLEAAERHALEFGYQVMLDAGHSVRGSYYDHSKIPNWPVDGVILWGQASQNLETFLGPRAQGLPAVYLGWPRTDDADYVAFDGYGGMRQVVAHLAVQGYARLCYVSPYDFLSGKHLPDPRVQAFLDGCREAGTACEFHILEPQEETRRAGLAAGLAIAALPPQKRPRALICHNDVVAVGVYHGLLRAGLRVPEDIAVTGFDGIEEGQCLDKPLTTVITSGDELCRVAVGLLSDRLAGRQVPSPQVLLPAELRVGETT